MYCFRNIQVFGRREATEWRREAPCPLASKASLTGIDSAMRPAAQRSEPQLACGEASLSVAQGRATEGYVKRAECRCVKPA